MTFGKLVHISQLQVGDVVRPHRGLISSDIKPEPLGGPNDHRCGYDTMTVTTVTDSVVDMVRPYIASYGSKLETICHPGMEKVSGLHRDNNNLWYELLG